MTVLVTGVAGFIGFFVAKRLLADGYSVVGIDNLNEYYDVRLKEARLNLIKDHPNFEFVKLDIFDLKGIQQLFASHSFEVVINLAAQAGVRYSIENPHAYADSNLAGFLNILEGCQKHQVQHLVFASSSSVYGKNQKVPFSTSDNVDNPISFYAATKKANELMAHVYSSLYGLPVTGLRFFTVYGPLGRPDMAYFKFVDSIVNERPIEVFNYGKMKRDFTYIDDIVEGVVRVMQQPPAASKNNQGEQTLPYKIYNIGNNNPVELLHFIEVIEAAVGKPAQKIMKPMQPGDVPTTYADIDDLVNDTGFTPGTSIEEGISRFVDWYKSFYSC